MSNKAERTTKIAKEQGFANAQRYNGRESTYRPQTEL